VKAKLLDISFKKGYAHRKSSWNLLRDHEEADESHFPEYLDQARKELATIEQKYFGAESISSDYEVPLAIK
jgi:hypothetical protein